MKKLIFSGIIFFCFLLISKYAFTHDIDAGISIGYIGPLINVNDIGNEFFGQGAGHEWTDIIGVKNIHGTYWITGNVRYHLTKMILIEADAGFWKKTKRTTPASANYLDVDSIFRDISIGSNIVLTSAQPKIRPYAGAGIDIHFLGAKINPIGYQEIAEHASKSKIGACAFAGVDIRWRNNIWIFVAGRFDIVSNWKQWKIYSGIRFTLFGTHVSK